MRADLGFIGLDDFVDRRWVKVAFLGQHGFERADAQLHLVELRAVLVVIVVVIMVVSHGGHSIPGTADCPL